MKAFHRSTSADAYNLSASEVWALVILTLYSSGSDPPALEVLPPIPVIVIHRADDSDPPIKR